MMPAAKHFDPVLGVDIHMIQPPGPVPPIPVPHPFIGMVIDPMDYVPILGATVMVGGIPRAQAGTAGKNIPAHIPIGGTFIKPPGNECEVFMGSATVEVDGDAFTYLALPALSCQDVGMPPPPRARKKSKTKSLVLPLSVVMAVPSGVLVGGPPTISLMALGMRAGMAGAGKLFKKFKAARKARKAKGKGKGKGKKGKAKENSPCGTDAHPVDVVTGACVDEIIDYNPPGEGAFRWIRYYDSSECERDGPMGRGFRHAYEMSLEDTPTGFRYTDETGAATELPPPPLSAAGAPVVADGTLLRRLGADLFEVLEPRQRFIRFRFLHPHHPAVPVEIRRGASVMRLGYDRDGRVLWVWDGEGRLYHVQHDTARRVVAIHQRAAEPPHAPMHTLLRFQYDAHGCLTGVMDVFGSTCTYQYESQRLTSMRDRRGFRFFYVYDEHGRVVHTYGEDGIWDARLEYVPEANMTVIRYADGGEWIKFYDAQGMVTDVVQPDGGLLTRRIDEHGRVAEEVDAGGRALAFVYDGFGAHVGRRDQFGRMLVPVWDPSHPPDINAPRIPQNAAGWEYGSLLYVEGRTFGGISEPALQLIPRAAREALQLGPTPPAAPRLELDALGRTTAAVYPDGSRATWQYDPEGNCVQYIDRDGSVYGRTYTSWNRLATETDPLGNVTRYEYSLRGEVVRVVDGGGAVTAYARDAMERICSVAREGAVRESYQWSPGNCLVAKRGTSGDVLVAYELGEHGLPVAQTLASGGQHALAYDARGRPVLAATDQHAVAQAWDERGQRVQDLRDGAGVVRAFGPEGSIACTLLGSFTTKYEFRNRGDLDVIDPTGARHRIRVDRAGLARRELSSGRVEVSYFGEQGRCCGKHVSGDGDGAWTRRFVYSPAGDLREVHDDRAGVTRYRYDQAHRVIAEARANEPERRIRYDRAGNIIAMAGFGNASFAPGNRLSSVGDERFEHNPRNHVSARYGRRGAERYVYDSLDMLVGIERDGDRAWSWRAAYDPFGRRAWKEWNGRRTEFFWEGDRLAGERAADGSVRVYTYADADALVPLLFVDYANMDADPAEGLRRFVFTNQIGAPVRVEDDAARVLWSALIEPYGRTTISADSTIELNLRFPGHYFDAETGLHYNRHRYYSPELGRYLQSDPIGAGGGLNVYAYTANPLVRVDVLGLTCKDTDGKASGNYEAPPGQKTAKLGDDVDDIAKANGMDPKHVKNLQERCATSPNGERIIVRSSNPDMPKWQKEPYNGKPTVAKPVEVKANTAKHADPHAGLVKQSPPKDPPPPGHKWDENGVLVTDPGGQAVRGDYDLQGVTDNTGKPVNTNDPEYRRGLNEDVCPETNQFQHGANDDYKPIKDADGKVVSVEGGDKPGRYPGADEKFTVFEPDGTVRQIDDPKELKKYYDSQTPPLDWPYGDKSPDGVPYV